MNITPDAWPADTEALRTRIARLEAQLARHERRGGGNIQVAVDEWCDENDLLHMDLQAAVARADKAEARITRLEAQSEARRLQVAYWQERARTLAHDVDRLNLELDSWMTRAYAAEKQTYRADMRLKAVRDEAPTIPADDNDRAWLIMSDLEAGRLFAWQDVLNILDASPNRPVSKGSPAKRY